MDIQAKYRDRKGHLSQNVLSVCSFDHKFQYVLAGWEGSAADSRVLASALSRSDLLVVPPSMSSHLVNGYIVTLMISEVMIIKVTQLVHFCRKILFSGCWISKCTRISCPFSFYTLYTLSSEEIFYRKPNKHSTGVT